MEKLRGIYREYSMYPLPLHMQSLPHYQHSSPHSYMCYNWWTWIDSSLSSKSIVYITVPTWSCTFCEFGKRYDDINASFGIILNIFTNVKILCAFLIHPPFSLSHPSFTVCSFAFSRMPCLYIERKIFRVAYIT